MENNTELDQNISPEELSDYSLVKVISYASAWFTDSLILAFFGVIMFYFYEVEVGLNVFLVGIAFVIFAIWNMINDPLLGYLSEKPRSPESIKKFGFRTPWLLIFGFLMAVVFFFVFLPPDVDASTNQLLIFIYMVVLICLLDGCYTIYNSNMAAGAINMFTTDKDRRKISAWALILSTLGVLVVNAIILPNVIKYGDRQSFVMAAGITAIVIIANLFVLTYGIIEPDIVKEYYIKGRDKEKGEVIALMEVIKAALKKKNFIIYIIAYLFWAIAFNLFYASQVYFYKDVLRVDFSYYMYAFMAFFIGFILTIPLWLKFAKKYGHGNLYGLGYILIGIVFFNLFWISNIVQLIVLMLIGGICYAASASVLVAVQGDAYDEVTATLGVHQEATLQGVTNFFIRLAYLFVGIILTTVHILTNYNPDPNAIQTPLAILGIRIHSGIIPGIFCICAGIIFLLLYDLKGDKKVRMKEQLKKVMEGKA